VLYLTVSVPTRVTFKGHFGDIYFVCTADARSVSSS